MHKYLPQACVEMPMNSSPFSNPPQSPPIPSPYGAPPPVAGSFVSARRGGQAARVLLGINIVADVLSILFGAVMALSMRALGRGGSPMMSPEALDSTSGLLAMAKLGLLLATAIVFLCWLNRSHRNLPALGAAGLEFTPVSAVGNFFIPFLNLVRPPQILAEVWKASDPEVEGDALAWKQRKAPKFIDGWWVCWILAGVIGNVASSMSIGPRANYDSLATGSLLDIVSGVFSIGAALLAMRMIAGIVESQDARHARLQNAAPSPLPF